MGGKTNAPTEFGAKVEVSGQNGYACTADLRRDAFNQGGTLQASAERYKATTGRYPAKIFSDELFAPVTTWSTANNAAFISMVPTEQAAKGQGALQGAAQARKGEFGERKAIECIFGVGKRSYFLG